MSISSGQYVLFLVNDAADKRSLCPGSLAVKVSAYVVCKNEIYQRGR